VATEAQVIDNELETVEFNFSLRDDCAPPWPCRLFSAAEADVRDTEFGKCLALVLGKALCATNTDVVFTCVGARESLIISVQSRATYVVACVLVQSMFELSAISGLFWPQFLFVDNMGARLKTEIQEHKHRLSYCYNNDHEGGLVWQRK
jgi:hypothetical protein